MVSWLNLIFIFFEYLILITEHWLLCTILLCKIRTKMELQLHIKTSFDLNDVLMIYIFFWNIFRRLVFCGFWGGEPWVPGALPYCSYEHENRVREHDGEFWAGRFVLAYYVFLTSGRTWLYISGENLRCSLRRIIYTPTFRCSAFIPNCPTHMQPVLMWLRFYLVTFYYIARGGNTCLS